MEILKNIYGILTQKSANRLGEMNAGEGGVEGGERWEGGRGWEGGGERWEGGEEKGEKEEEMQYRC